MTDEQRSALMKLAAEMVLCNNMPPEHSSDWLLPKTTPVTARREITAVSRVAHSQCKNWSKRLVKIIDEMKAS